MTLVTIVTVTYNSAPHLPEFFDCLISARSKCGDHGVELATVVVDNASTDASVAIARRISTSVDPTVVPFPQQHNLGVAAGNNVGIAKSLQDHADFVLLLNNDVTFPDDLVLNLLNANARWGSDQAMIAPQIVFQQPSDKLWYDGGHVSKRRGFTAVHERLGHSRASSDFAERQTGYASTCALLIPARVFEVVGVMDEDFFVYCDDVDFALRASKAGFATVITPNAVLVHKVGASSGGVRSPFGAKWETMGRVVLARKHGSPGLQLWTYLYLVFWSLWQLAALREPLAITIARLRALLQGGRRPIRSGPQP